MVKRFDEFLIKIFLFIAGMGLGKSFEIIAFLHTVLQSKLLNFRTALIIAPYNTVLNWVAEFDKWLGDDPELQMRVIFFFNEIFLAKIK